MASKQSFLAAMLFWSVAASSQTAQDSVYVFQNDQPNAVNFLPAPPDTSSAVFFDDMVQYQWGKSVRNTPRGRQASIESSWTADAMRVIMAEALGLEAITPQATPALDRLLVKTYNTGNDSPTAPRDFYKRLWPCQQMNDPLLAQYAADNQRANGSYPSCPTASGWATALVFAEMWPELQDTILRRGFLFGENCVINGTHYQSDVTVGFLCGAASIARAHTNPELEKDILAARAEYARLKGLPENYDPVTAADVPHGECILNNPIDTTSYRYITDMTQYWGAKPLRSSERGKRAATEAEYSVTMMCHVFGEAANITLSADASPAIYALLDTVLVKASETADRLKPIRFRKRPFVQLGEPSFVPGDEEKERGKSSFPSGHTNLGWVTALIMAEVAPEYQDTILRRGFDYGYNRLIVGYHWFTDIEATRQMSAALVARLHADAGIRQMIAAARAEYVGQEGSAVRSVSAPNASADGRTYTLSGRQATETTHGIVIKDGRKSIR